MHFSFIGHFKTVGLSRVHTCLSGISGLVSSNPSDPDWKYMTKGKKKNIILNLLKGMQIYDGVIFITDSVFEAFSLSAHWTKHACAGEKGYVYCSAAPS